MLRIIENPWPTWFSIVPHKTFPAQQATHVPVYPDSRQPLRHSLLRMTGKTWLTIGTSVHQPCLRPSACTTPIQVSNLGSNKVLTNTRLPADVCGGVRMSSCSQEPAATRTYRAETIRQNLRELDNPDMEKSGKHQPSIPPRENVKCAWLRNSWPLGMHACPANGARVRGGVEQKH